jgi:hypothetical protein
MSTSHTGKRISQVIKVLLMLIVPELRAEFGTAKAGIQGRVY